MDKDIHYFYVTILLFIKQGMDVTSMFYYEILWISKAFDFLKITSKDGKLGRFRKLTNLTL